MDSRHNFIDKMKAYHLQSSLWVLLALILVFIGSLFIYLLPAAQNDAVISNIMLALFTSLLATIFTTAADIFIQYRHNRNDDFIQDVHQFGIDKLNVGNKDELIKGLLKNTHTQIWISGYRLAMTHKLSDDFVMPIKERELEVTLLLCPPWSDAYKLTYGTLDRTMDNYFGVLKAFYDTRKTSKIRVLFTEKPLFSDTYRMDDCIVTGPYMHSTNPNNMPMSAQDFFSYKVSNSSKLHEIITADFEALCSDAKHQLDWEKFLHAYQAYCTTDSTEEQKRLLLRDSLIDIAGKE